MKVMSDANSKPNVGLATCAGCNRRIQPWRLQDGHIWCAPCFNSQFPSYSFETGESNLCGHDMLSKEELEELSENIE